MKLVLNKNNFLVFFISILFCVVLKLFEEFVGIGWDYHPDALLYINSSDFIVSQIKLNSSFFNYLNNGYYFLVSFLNSSKLLLVSLNVILYSLTNVLFYKKIKYFKSKYFYLFFYL